MAFSISGALGLKSGKSTTNSSSSYKDKETFTRGDYDTTALLTDLADQTQAFDLNLVIADANNRAARDVSGAIGNIFRQYQETALPEIFNAQTQTGAYAGSSAQLMANDAFARATNQSAELQLGVASSYIGQALSARDQLMQQFSQLLQANLQQSGTAERSGSSKGKQVTRTREASLSLGFGPKLPGTFTGD